MPLCSSQNILVFRVEIKLGAIPTDISKVAFAKALSRILTHIRILRRR
jgi:hypothetical protein